MMANDLFKNISPEMEKIIDGVYLFRTYVDSELFYRHIMEISKVSPFRHMVTPGGKQMNIAITNAGDAGWYSDRRGYRYQKIDPFTNKPWPNLPDSFLHIATEAAHKAGFFNYKPDSCLINCYEPGKRLTPHQDKNEQDFNQPIVSISLGVSAIFQMYGDKRGGSALNIPLHNGDLLVFGGPARHHFHGVKKLEKDHHPLTQNKRYNLTFRKAL
jgi:DNA oxidative demethylase